MSLLAYSLRSFINESLPCWLDCWYVVDLMRKESTCFLLVRNIDIKILRKNVVILVYFKATAITVIDFFDLLASFSSTSLGFVVFVLITQRNYHRLNLLFHKSHIHVQQSTSLVGIGIDNVSFKEHKSQEGGAKAKWKYIPTWCVVGAFG